jgi:S-adenosylmethionine:tRNA ribosyltransferase-isomerase
MTSFALKPPPAAANVIHYQTGRLARLSGETGFFIKPGYRFRAINGLVTNFHRPRSTMMMLVSAFSRIDPMRAASAHAIAV